MTNTLISRSLLETLSMLEVSQEENVILAKLPGRWTFMWSENVIPWSKFFRFVNETWAKPPGKWLWVNWVKTAIQSQSPICDQVEREVFSESHIKSRNSNWIGIVNRPLPGFHPCTINRLGPLWTTRRRRRKITTTHKRYKRTWRPRVRRSRRHKRC